MKMTDGKQLYSNYQRHFKKESKIILLWQLIIALIFFLSWELASRFYLIDPLLFRSPTRIFELISTRISNGTLFPHIAVTLFETLLGFILGTIGGILIATALWYSTRLARITDPYLVIFN